ncbi:MAG: phage protein GemA/Gp16 family protein, partial [Anaerovorax sp.]
MRMIEAKQIKIIWASAREHGIDRQSVYDVITAMTGKEHMKELTYMEAAKVIGRISGSGGQKRTDEGGNEDTVELRRKIYKLTGELGWNDNNSRINGLCRKMFGAEQLLWLSPRQCHKLIEAL